MNVILSIHRVLALIYDTRTLQRDTRIVSRKPRNGKLDKLAFLQMTFYTYGNSIEIGGVYDGKSKNLR